MTGELRQGSSLDDDAHFHFFVHGFKKSRIHTRDTYLLLHGNFFSSSGDVGDRVGGGCSRGLEGTRSVFVR